MQQSLYLGERKAKSAQHFSEHEYHENRIELWRVQHEQVGFVQENDFCCCIYTPEVYLSSEVELRILCSRACISVRERPNQHSTFLSMSIMRIESSFGGCNTNKWALCKRTIFAVAFIPLKSIYLLKSSCEFYAAEPVSRQEKGQISTALF